MKVTKYALGAALGLFLIGGATNARADGIDDTFTLTDGTNTMTWSFTSASSITPDGSNGFIVNNPGGVLIGGTTTFLAPGGIEFFTPAGQGGLASNPNGSLFDIFDMENKNTLFNGSLSSPTFVPGDYSFTDSFNFWTLSDPNAFDLKITSTSQAVPEPSSLLLLGIGLAGLASTRWKSLRRLA